MLYISHLTRYHFVPMHQTTNKKRSKIKYVFAAPIYLYLRPSRTPPGTRTGCTRSAPRPGNPQSCCSGPCGAGTAYRPAGAPASGSGRAAAASATAHAAGSGAGRGGGGCVVVCVCVCVLGGGTSGGMDGAWLEGEVQVVRKIMNQE